MPSLLKKNLSQYNCTDFEKQFKNYFFLGDLCLGRALSGVGLTLSPQKSYKIVKTHTKWSKNYAKILKKSKNHENHGEKKNMKIYGVAGPDKFFTLGRHKSDGISSYTCRILFFFGESESWGRVDVSYAQKRWKRLSIYGVRVTKPEKGPKIVGFQRQNHVNFVNHIWGPSLKG